jgi:hypothetical protein
MKDNAMSNAKVQMPNEEHEIRISGLMEIAPWQ